MWIRRTRAREVALQLLFQREVNAQLPRPVLEEFATGRLRDPGLVQFCLGLYDGVVAQQKTLDARIVAAAQNWRLTRMTGVDRNVIRLGAYEALFTPQETPAPVAINEAIELARAYGTADSPAFVNGVLDRVVRDGIIPKKA
jgi:N utilization substance protein B